MREHGSIAGNPALRSRVHVTNRHWFSYPGYSEILVGRAHDDVIKSNAPTQNPNRTVLEFLQSTPRLVATAGGGVRVVGRLHAIVEHTAGALTVNAGYRDIRFAGSAECAATARCSSRRRRRGTAFVMTSTPSRFAMDHLARHRPRVLYLALDETDDWAHDARYDRVLEAYARTDRYPARAVGVAAVAAGLSRSHQPADHDRPRPRPHAGRLARPWREDRRRRRNLDGLRLAVVVAPRRVARSRAAHRLAGGSHADHVDGRRLEAVQPALRLRSGKPRDHNLGYGLIR